MDTSVDHARGIFRSAGGANPGYVYRVPIWRGILTCGVADSRGGRRDGCRYLEAR